ncbi:MAG: bifunctional hydroxymethylpyrimidine kinase/phosphomethylpyrimidine kinase [Hyphomicrobiaceae bacterium]|nr:bifunctional hydroxymethylpyrimidine kinase/phosphomethylpyrimidine kinase [Hyphomicrobiaceae bacterium]
MARMVAGTARESADAARAGAPEAAETRASTGTGLPEARPQPPVVLTIAGSDPSGGAGIQADLKTFQALGVYGAAVITALTAQNTVGVRDVHVAPAGFVAAQIAAVADDIAISATKTGMLADRAIIAAVADEARRGRLGRLVVDPVMVATSGDLLIAPDAVEALRASLLPLADLVTPNLAEAARLVGEDIAGSDAAAIRQGQAILGMGARAVLVKGGDGPAAGDGGLAIDHLVTREGVRSLPLPRIATANTHGTGCTLAAAIAAHLALGLSLEEAVAAAKSAVWRGLTAARGWRLGEGQGPLDHAALSLPSGEPSR